MQLSSENFLAAVEWNQCCMFNLFHGLPGVEIHRPAPNSDFFSILTETSLPVFNNVLRVRVSSEQVREVVHQFTERYKVKRAPAMWWISPLTTPADLASVLSDHGWQLMDEQPVGMSADLKSVQDYSLLRPGSEEMLIRPVEQAEHFHAFSQLLTEVFELSSSAVHIITDMFSHPDFDLQRSFLHYLGFLNGHPVAAGSVFIKDNVAGIYNVCVSPDARKRGFGETMTRYLLYISRQNGCKRSVLQSSLMAKRLYERMGFEQCGAFKLFLLND